MPSQLITLTGTALSLLISAATTLHILLYKQRGRAAIGWIGLMWLVPVIGPLLYLFLGINRIERKLKRLGVQPRCVLPNDPKELVGVPARMRGLARAIGRVSNAALIPGNDVTFLYTGDVCYPAMIEAIDGAESSVAVLSYMFDNDAVGNEVADALKRATDRGVAVRVLIDGVGSMYSLPPIVYRLSREGVINRRFLWSLVPWRMAVINLRNHRKLCIVDGRVAFTGGMNIRVNNRLASDPKDPVQDLHARVTGPIVGELMRVFTDDWQFSSGEDLADERWWPELSETGDAVLRCLPAGPDATVESVRWTYLTAIQQATERICILTPYFLPEDDLLAALSAAALRGVTVDLYLPGAPNVSYLWWATQVELPQLIEREVRVWQCDPPFAHTKLMVVDDAWVLFGSANWDARSLRLNFELNVESYSKSVVQDALDAVRPYTDTARRLTLEGLAPSRFQRLRGRAARLMQPYL